MRTRISQFCTELILLGIPLRYLYAIESAFPSTRTPIKARYREQNIAHWCRMSGGLAGVCLGSWDRMAAKTELRR